MRVISKRRLREFWANRKHDGEIAQRHLTAWHKLAKNAEWRAYGELKQTFGSADRVGNCTVFDIGNNRYRLIARVNFRRGIIYVLKVMNHNEYDKKPWADQCGCYQPPPK